MTSKTTRRRLIKASAATVAAATIPGAASANHGGSEGAFFSGSRLDDDSRLAKLLALGDGYAERYLSSTPAYDDAAAIGAELQDHFNTRNSDYLTWINDRNKGGSDHQVFELQLEHAGTSDTRYLVSSYDTDNERYTSAEFTTSTSREVDYASRLSGDPAAEAPSDLREFYRKFVGPNEDITGAYKSRMGAKYVENENVVSELLGDEL